MNDYNRQQPIYPPGAWFSSLRQMTDFGRSEKQRIFSMRVFSYVLITLTAVILRLSISFSYNLIIGMDGGYYPVQVRNILNTGFLSFNDVPIYFYFCASIVKAISLLGFTVTDETIITVIKIIDSAALPLLAIPLFHLVTRIAPKISLVAEMTILSFAVFSFTPFIILGDLQKNAFAIPLAFLFIYLLQEYLQRPSVRKLSAVVISLIAIALTHFGVFVFCMVFLILTLFVVYRKNAILPSLLIVVIGCGLIALFDFNRASRLLTFWMVLFERPAILQGFIPFPILLNLLVSYFLIGLGIFQFQRHRDQLDKVSEYLLLTLLAVLAIFSFPFIDQEYLQRFNILLFIPQLLVIVFLVRMNKKLAPLFSISLVLLTVLSVLIYFSEGKKPCIDDQTFQDLQNIRQYLPENKENSIIIARHGLEFWTAWALKVRVGQDRAMGKIGLDKYSSVILLQQNNEENQGPLGRKRLHIEGMGMAGHPPSGPPMGSGMVPRMGRPVPENFSLIYSSPTLNAYQRLK